MAGKSILKVLFTLTHLSPLGESVVSAADFYKVKDKAQFLHGDCTELVKIQRRVSRKRYLGSKYVNPENSTCEKYKPKTTYKYIW